MLVLLQAFGLIAEVNSTRFLAYEYCSLPGSCLWTIVAASCVTALIWLPVILVFIFVKYLSLRLVNHWRQV